APIGDHHVDICAHSVKRFRIRQLVSPTPEQKPVVAWHPECLAHDRDLAGGDGGGGSRAPGFGNGHFSCLLSSRYLSTIRFSGDQTIAYAQRGRGERKRPTSGWESLTPTELDVVRLVAEGIPNKDIAGRLFVSPRTVQSHLRHIYPKLGLTSRVQLAQEASRHS
ncbi:MAG TPA: helix-turn-helix transcriptional regulator, partial [Mycobacterium sp.]|nr:helix-turn-helix transcriptional regulator [Mycobacterium sp.]